VLFDADVLGVDPGHPQVAGEPLPEFLPESVNGTIQSVKSGTVMAEITVNIEADHDHRVAGGIRRQRGRSPSDQHNPAAIKPPRWAGSSRTGASHGSRRQALNTYDRSPGTEVTATATGPARPGARGRRRGWSKR
jgi:hypothetical protein